MVLPWKFAQEPPPRHVLGSVAGRFQLRAHPEDRPLRTAAESLGIEQRRLVMVSQHAQTQLHHAINTLARIGAIADDVPQAINCLDALVADIVQDSVHGFQIPVNVADDRPLFHRLPSTPETALTLPPDSSREGTIIPATPRFPPHPDAAIDGATVIHQPIRRDRDWRVPFHQIGGPRPQSLAAFAQAIPQHIVQIGLAVNLANRLGHVVFQTAKNDRVFRQDRVA